MSRQLFTARVKGKREKFASTRTSLSESWDQSFCDDDGRVPGFPDLPSPTIGVKDIAIKGLTLLSQNPATISPIRHSRGQGGSGSGSSVEPSPRSSADPAIPASVWRRHVAIQCNMVHQQALVQVTRPLDKHELRFLHAHRHHPYLVSTKDPPRLGSSRRISKSLDWDEFPLSLHSPLWEPFCDLREPLPPTFPSIGSIGENYFYYTPPGVAQFIQEAPDEDDELVVELTARSLTTQHDVPCDTCLGLTASTVKDEIDSLTSSLVQQAERDKFKATDAESSDRAGQSQSPIVSTPTGSQGRPPRPSLAFTLPIPQLTLTGQAEQSVQSQGSKVKNVSVKTAAPHPTYYSASLDQATEKPPEPAVEGRGKSSTLPTIDNRHIVAIRNAEKRRRFFARKQTNSAPDSFEASSFFNVTTHGVINTTRRLCGNCKEPVTNCLDGVLRATRRERTDPSTVTPTVEVWESEIRTARCGDVSVTHVSELDFPDADPPCHFCCEQASTAIHDESRLQIVSGGLVRSRDGSARSGANPYINLPSPNVQAENGSQGVAFGSIDLSPSMSSQTTSPAGHHHHHHHHQHGVPQGSSGRTSATPTATTRTGPGGKGDEEDPLVGPPVSSLTRRPALVPPKIMSDADYENESDRDKYSSRNSDDNTSPRTRRSSIVVIPPMQICPGDLLVYGKVLSQRKSLLGTTIESPSPVTSMFEQDNTPTRKGKATWSLLKLFERSSRTKGGGAGTLEDVMSIIQPCDFSDPKLSRFKGMCWSDFANYVVSSRKKNSTASVTSPQDEEVDFLLPRITGSLADPKLIPAGGVTIPAPTNAASSSTPCETLLVNTTTIATGTVGTEQGSPPSESVLANLAKGTVAKKAESSPKPLVRKRMGLMRTMSDRCLERRITPALWRATPGFLLGEKLVEGKEPEVSGTKTNGTKVKASTSKSAVSGVSIPAPLTETETLTKDTSVPTVEESTSTVVPDPDHRQKLRQKEALWDLFQSECSFLYDHLMVLKNVFLEPLKRIQVEGFAMYAEPELLFGTLDELCCVTYGFCKEFIHLLLKLTNTTGELSTTEVLAKLFEPSSKARAMSQAYHRYALNYINALNYLETLRRHAEFGEFEKFCMRDPRCKKLQLTDLLVSPVQHIMKVPLILKDIQSRTNQPQEKELIAQILEIQENSIRELDDKMRWLKNFERLLEIQRNIVWPSILEMEPKTWVPEFLRVPLARQPCDSLVVSPRRQIIHEGLLQLWDTGKATETYVILFDDMLLITRRKKGLSKKKSSLTDNWASSCKNTGVVGSGLETNHRYIVYRQPISLDRFFIHDIGEAENTTAKLDFAFVLVSLNRFQQIVSVHTFQATSDIVKTTWLQKLKTTQDKWKRTLQNTVFRGVRNSTDSTQSNVASALLNNIQTKSFLRRET